MRRTYAAWLALLTASCSSPAPEPRQNASGDVAADGQNYSAIVSNLDPEARKGVLFRAIRDAGLPCQEVTEAEAQPAIRNAPVWRARCQDGSYHLIQVTPDGTATVISRAGN